MKISSMLSSLPLAAAFVPQQSSINTKKTSLNNAAELAIESEEVVYLPINKAIFDPLGLYPKDSPERVNGLIQPLESSSSTSYDDKTVQDPLSLYQDQSQVSVGGDMSASLPFLPRPTMLDGSLAGDRGFDPFNFASDENSLQWQRRAEVKHSRLAMLAAVGWPIAELAHKSIASVFDLPAMLASGDRVPSVLNDGLEHSFPLFWIATIAAASFFEIEETVHEERYTRVNPADISFNPFAQNMRYMEEGELFNGRLAMLAITGFAIQESFLNSAVVDQIPIFFKPMNVVFEQLMNAQ